MMLQTELTVQRSMQIKKASSKALQDLRQALMLHRIKLGMQSHSTLGSIQAQGVLGSATNLLW